MNKFHPWLIVIIRILLGIIFIYASYDKILDPGKFARDIANYHLIPMGFENLIALIIPWLEVFIGIRLVAGLMVDGASMISGGLMAFFILFILQATLRGFNIECGCGLKEGQLVGVEKILENFVYLGGAYILYIRKRRLLEIFPKTDLSDK